MDSERLCLGGHYEKGMQSRIQKIFNKRKYPQSSTKDRSQENYGIVDLESSQLVIKNQQDGESRRDVSKGKKVELIYYQRDLTVRSRASVPRKIAWAE